jgi:hypothetical protein
MIVPVWLYRDHEEAEAIPVYAVLDKQSAPSLSHRTFSKNWGSRDM